MLEFLKQNGIEEIKANDVVKAMKEAKIFTTKLENADERYSKLKEQKKELEEQIKNRDKQLEDLTVKAKGNEELTKQLEELKATNAKTVEEYEAKIKANEFNYALDRELNRANSKNNKALKALLDIDSIKYQEGKFEGLESQIKALKESDSYLFKDTTPSNTGGVGNFARSNNLNVGANSQSNFIDAIKNNQIRK